LHWLLLVHGCVDAKVPHKGLLGLDGLGLAECDTALDGLAVWEAPFDGLGVWDATAFDGLGVWDAAAFDGDAD
jgi:hypothetical protein